MNQLLVSQPGGTYIPFAYEEHSSDADKDRLVKCVAYVNRVRVRAIGHMHTLHRGLVKGGL